MTAVSTPATSDWIACSERLPDDGRFVLVWLPHWGACCGKFVAKSNSWRITGKSGPVSRKNITHWADIRKPTK